MRDRGGSVLGVLVKVSTFENIYFLSTPYSFYVFKLLYLKYQAALDEKEYAIEMKLLLECNPNTSIITIRPQAIEMKICKEIPGVDWVRLLKTKNKPEWLKVNKNYTLQGLNFEKMAKLNITRPK